MFNDNTEMSPELLARWEQVMSTPLTFAESLLWDPTTDEPFVARYPQRAILSGTRKNFWICVHRRAGKCVTESTKVINPITLKPTTIRLAQEFQETAVFEFSTNKVVMAPCEWKRSGEKRVLRLYLGSGVEQELSEDHAVFCKKRGWIQSSQLLVGDEILAPSKLPIYGDIVPTEDQLQKDLDETLALSRFSDQVYRYTERSLNRFLKAFFFAKGRILHGQNLIAFMLWNRELSLELHHLMLRVGVELRVDRDGNCFIEDHIDRAVFLNTCGFEHTVTEVRSPRRWERVVKKRSIGTHPVYDLMVAHEDHNFIGNDLVLHNSYALSLIAIWHALRQKRCKVVIFAPASNQIDELFGVIRSWINHPKNAILHMMKAPDGDTKDPQLVTFTNGSTIKGMTLGLSGGEKQKGKTRGSTADVVIVDEAQDLDEKDWKGIKPVMMGDETRRKLGRMRGYVAGTLVGPSGQFYERVVKTGESPTDAILFMPVTQNKGMTPEQVEALRLEVGNDAEWEQEYLLNVTESENAVFKKSEIDSASEDDYEYGYDNVIDELPRFITVDWDKVQCGTNILVTQYSPLTKRLVAIDHLEVPQSDFHYLDACRKVMEYYDLYKPELVVCDSGAADMQLEWLMDQAIRANSDLANRLVKCVFHSKLTIPNTDPTSDKETVDKTTKPVLVDLLRQKFQNHLITYPSHHRHLTKQFYDYHVVRRTQNTIVFSADDEHIVDCFSFAMYALWLTYENPFQDYISSKKDRIIPGEAMGEEYNPEGSEKSLWKQITDSRGDLDGMQVFRSGFDGFDRGSF